MNEENNATTYSPELIPRQGEVVAWLLFIALFIVWIILITITHTIGWVLLGLMVIMLLAAASISLGNWMDRHTQLSVNSQGIVFSNGLRKVILPWQQIRDVHVRPAAWGKKVEIIGDRCYFDFHTLGEVKYAGEVKGRTGFMHGEAILQDIILHGQLKRVNQFENVTYYARK